MGEVSEVALHFLQETRQSVKTNNMPTVVFTIIMFLFVYIQFNATQLTISELTRLRITEYLTQRGYRQRLPDVINIGVKKSGKTPLKLF